MKLPKVIESGMWKEGHIQGIAVDTERGFVYYSFTTIFLKTDMLGNPIGSVARLAGHLGCITLGDDGYVYGSLELKHDAIGGFIISRTGWDPSSEDSFYLVRFDTEKITRMDMDAENDGIMTAIYLRDVVDDYSGTDEVSGEKHRYGCSGIDGTAYGPVFGEAPGSRKKLMVSYGIYGDVKRFDNDHQVILQFDVCDFERFGRPLNQSNPHHSGPNSCEKRYFIYTGNTTYGVQNLEYDSYSHNWLIAVYCGKKNDFTNYPMFICDGSVKPKEQELIGRGGEVGALLTLAKLGEAADRNGIRGVNFPYGSTGVASLGNGLFYFSKNYSEKRDGAGYFGSHVTLYRYDPSDPQLFTEVDD